MYVAVKGGEKAIDAAHALQESRRRGDTDLPELSVAQIEQQLNLAVDRVMTEGGIADRELAALALKQASGDNVEAIFLLRRQARGDRLQQRGLPGAGFPDNAQHFPRP